MQLFRDYEALHLEVASSVPLWQQLELLIHDRIRGHDQFFPLVLLTSEFPARLGISEDEDFTQSLYVLLESKYDTHISHGMESIRAGKATVEEARLLGIEIGETVLIIERLTYRRGDPHPFEFVQGSAITASQAEH